VNIIALSQSSDFLFLAPITDEDVCKAIKKLKPPTPAGLEDIPGFVVKGCSLRRMFNLSITQQYFPDVWKEVALVPIFKRGNHAAVSNYIPIPILSNFSKLFALIMQEHFALR
jgi:hypothetical protein